MNGRTAKLIRRWSRATRSNYRHTKRAWKRLSHRERGDTRKDLVEAIE